MAVNQDKIRVGWVTVFTFPRWRFKWFGVLPASTYMRCANTAKWINENHPEFVNELYKPHRRYDVVVFVKAMAREYQEEARRIQKYGGKVIFDANVNYYEVWGDYTIPGTKPTEEQQRDAIAMSELADQVVADSRYIEGVAKRFNPNVTWIPDNVNTSIYRRNPDPRREGGRKRIIWSGVAKKSDHLEVALPALAKLKDIELWLVSDGEPTVVKKIPKTLPYRVFPFSDRYYAKLLNQADVIISPKILANAYEMGHTEYKISLGMAVGLPAVASPQPSYIDILSPVGGYVVDNEGEWVAALSNLLSDEGLRTRLGLEGMNLIESGYSTPAVASKYALMLQEALAG